MAQQKPAAPSSVRLYILDCGIIVAMNPASYDLKPEESKGCFEAADCVDDADGPYYNKS